MKQVIFVGILTLAVSTGVGTAARLMVAPPHPVKSEAAAAAATAAAAAHSTRADTTLASSRSPGGSTTAVVAAAAGLPSGTASGSEAAVSSTEAVASAAPAESFRPPATPGAASSNPPPASRSTGPVIELKELGQIVRQMRPAEACLLLERLNDEQVLGIMRGMTVGDAVSILNSLPSTRSAGLRDRLLADPAAAR